MRRWALAPLVLLAYGSPARDASEVTIASAATATEAAAAALKAGPLDATLPRDAAATVTFDLDLLKNAAAGMFASAAATSHDRSRMNVNAQREFEAVLGVAKGSLLPDRIFDTLGLDPTRPAAFAIAPLSASGRERFARLEALSSKTKIPEDAPGSLRVGELKAAYGSGPALFRARLRLPVRDPGATKRALRHLLTTLHFREVAAPLGLELAMTHDGRTVAASTDGTWFVVDVFAGHKESDAPDPGTMAAIADLRGRGEGGVEPPSLGSSGGPTVRARLVPKAFAEVAFVYNLGKTLRAIGDNSDAVIDAIAATGFKESHRALELAGNDRGEFFRTVEVEADPGAKNGKAFLHAKAIFGPAYEGAARNAASIPRGGGIEAGAVPKAALDVAPAVGLAFALPGDTAGALIDESSYSRYLREAGTAGWFVAAPAIPILFMTLAIRPPPAVFAPKSAAMKLERIMVIDGSGGQGELFIGLIRRGTSEAEAGCVLAGTTPCASHALRPNASAVKVGEKFVRVTKDSDRYLVVVGSEAASVDGVHPTVERAEARPARASLPKDVFGDRATAVIFGPEGGSKLAMTIDVTPQALLLDVIPR